MKDFFSEKNKFLARKKNELSMNKLWFPSVKKKMFSQFFFRKIYAIFF